MSDQRHETNPQNVHVEISESPDQEWFIEDWSDDEMESRSRKSSLNHRESRTERDFSCPSVVSEEISEHSTSRSKSDESSSIISEIESNNNEKRFLIRKLKAGCLLAFLRILFCKSKEYEKYH